MNPIVMEYYTKMKGYWSKDIIEEGIFPLLLSSFQCYSKLFDVLSETLWDKNIWEWDLESL